MRVFDGKGWQQGNHRINEESPSAVCLYRLTPAPMIDAPPTSRFTLPFHQVQTITEKNNTRSFSNPHDSPVNPPSKRRIRELINDTRKWRTVVPAAVLVPMTLITLYCRDESYRVRCLSKGRRTLPIATRKHIPSQVICR